MRLPLCELHLDGKRFLVYAKEDALNITPHFAHVTAGWLSRLQSVGRAEEDALASAIYAYRLACGCAECEGRRTAALRDFQKV